MQKLGDNCYANPVVDRRNYSDGNAHEVKQGEKELRFFGAALGAFLFLPIHKRIITHFDVQTKFS